MKAGIWWGKNNKGDLGNGNTNGVRSNTMQCKHSNTATSDRDCHLKAKVSSIQKDRAETSVDHFSAWWLLTNSVKWPQKKNGNWGSADEIPPRKLRINCSPVVQGLCGTSFRLLSCSSSSTVKNRRGDTEETWTTQSALSRDITITQVIKMIAEAKCCCPPAPPTDT